MEKVFEGTADMLSQCDHRWATDETGEGREPFDHLPQLGVGHSISHGKPRYREPERCHDDTLAFRSAERGSAIEVEAPAASVEGNLHGVHFTLVEAEVTAHRKNGLTQAAAHQMDRYPGRAQLP